MPSRLVYDLLYRIGAARWKRGWDAGVSGELKSLVEDGTLSFQHLGGNRAIDLGCGSGANVVYLAQKGFDAVGVDFSSVSIRQAEAAAAAAGVEANFVVGDITRPLASVGGSFDLIVLYNVLQDLDGDARRRVATEIERLSRPGTRVLLWCWYASRAELPFVSYRGPSRLAPLVVEPGEEVVLFGDAFSLTRIDTPAGRHRAAFLLSRI